MAKKRNGKPSHRGRAQFTDIARGDFYRQGEALTKAALQNQGIGFNLADIGDKLEQAIDALAHKAALAEWAIKNKWPNTFISPHS